MSQVLFPLLTKLLENINTQDPSGMEETRMRASTLLCKVGRWITDFLSRVYVPSVTYNWCPEQGTCTQCDMCFGCRQVVCALCDTCFSCRQIDNWCPVHNWCPVQGVCAHCDTCFSCRQIDNWCPVQGACTRCDTCFGLSVVV